MKKKHLVPLAIFCVVFLAYAIYFVKVINSTTHVERNSISKTIKRALDQKTADEMAKNEGGGSAPSTISAPDLEFLDKPVTEYVTNDIAHLRVDPSLSSKVLVQVLKGKSVEVLAYHSRDWAFVRLSDGSRGYMVRNYLAQEPLEEKPVVAQNLPNVTPPTSVTVPEQSTPAATLPGVYNIPIITYHHITDTPELYSESLTLATINFTTQLDWLIRNGYKTYTFEDLESVTAGKKAAEKAVILVFDGGYNDAYIAAQHMNGKGLKGVFAITTDKVGQNGYMEWRQIKKLRSWGMGIASRGVTGADLVNSSDYYRHDEIERSKQVLEKELGEPIIVFVYPAGRYNSEVSKIVEEAGYAYARTIDNGTEYKSEDFYELPSLRIFPQAASKQLEVWLGQ
ncbi:MAG: polysaccharide deacetylase family protein [bacterium]|nr:polysaccharide deacetylase family protein [bacterium]